MPARAAENLFWFGRYGERCDGIVRLLHRCLERDQKSRLHDIADVLKTLNFIMTRKTLSFREKKMYERAKYLIVSEIAVINNMDEQEVERLVDRALAKSAQSRAASH